MEEFSKRLREAIILSLLTNNSPKQIRDMMNCEISALRLMEDLENLGKKDEVLQYIDSREKGIKQAFQKQQTKPKAEVLP